MKALKLALAISLVLNLALGWHVWREPQPPTEAQVTHAEKDTPLEPSPNSALETTALTYPLPDPAVEQEMATPTLLPPPSLTLRGMQYEVEEKRPAPMPGSFREARLGGQGKRNGGNHLFDSESSDRQDRPYAEPLPSNPYAVPLWERRVPYREGQMQRTLFDRLPQE